MRQRLKSTFYDLVGISEVHPDEDRIITYVEDRLRSSGVRIIRDSFNNLVAKVEGDGQPMLISTHMDIPEPNPGLKTVEEGDIIRTDGQTILGADPKSGLAVLIEFLIDLKSAEGPHHPAEAVITRGEEVGLVGATNLDYGLVGSKMGLVLDEDGPVERVITKAPYQVNLDITLRGKKGHPRDPSEGRNVLHAMAAALSRLPPGHATDGVTWNIGRLEAGSARNTIPGRMKILAELRGYSGGDVEDARKLVHGCFSQACSERGIGFEMDSRWTYDGYQIPEDSILLQYLESAYRRMNLKPSFHSTFGGSDANIFNSQGIETVPVGSAYYNAHQHDEYVDLREMQRMVEFLHTFFARRT